MRRATLFLALLLSLAPHAAGAADCGAQALERLRRAAPEGFAVFRRVEASRPGFFASWLACDGGQFELPTAVHESTHVATEEADAFPLLGGGAVARPHAVSAFFPPAAIAGRFAPDDFTAIYLTRGKASSATDFLYLLDEMNAYAHDLDTAVALARFASPDLAMDHRDGLAATMAFVAAYADEARARRPDAWAGLRDPDVAGAVTALWSAAEGAMSASCGIPNYGTLDRGYIGRVCGEGRRSALAAILGRAPACPSACLEAPSAPDASDGPTPPDDVAAGEDVTLDVEPTASLAPRHPFAAAAGPRRHPARGD